MKLPERALALMPKRWPVRWRLAAVSATLTLVILVIFALVVGRLTSNRLHNDFNDDVRGTASTIATQTQVQTTPFRRILTPQPQTMGLAPNATVRYVYHDGSVLPNGASADAPDLGPPDINHVRDVGGFAVAAYPVPTTLDTVRPVYVEYARSQASINATVNRLWLFLALGVLGGTMLAALAGMAIAGRAMRPIAVLTATAREIAFTRDPSQRIPEPERDDEVGELARTLERMLRQLDAARAETEQMMHLQREFVADASHELRTPLTSILANLELLQERLESADPSGEDAEMVDSALRSSRRMSRLVSDLLLLARADAGRSGTRRTCDLGEVVSAAVSEVRPVADGHVLTVDELGSVPVQGNPDELHRLCVNLLDNGLRHTPEGSEIHVAVQRRNGSAVIEVSDDGPGIPAGMEEQIFSRFVRGAGPADVAANTGTGLGLAIVKAVANSHGGDVEAGSSPKGGARFVVRLPAT
ncbi:MAG TPA: HAMP domain-containing sensor histidine kinase [Solirubrobacterales bacterium]|nr:HAMP domain-containing sensor histidine kinase [Solirubrobacterales bacterium]